MWPLGIPLGAPSRRAGGADDVLGAGVAAVAEGEDGADPGERRSGMPGVADGRREAEAEELGRRIFGPLLGHEGRAPMGPTRT
ncbi:hypothetical protein ACFVZW_31395 [Streptomyces sp. NPDC059567]|uniref:hypothetical protein n=1 Tax=Streptomyces sp. NPDC059567 TaxID=3346867 RepID=UPI00368E03C5